MLAQLLCSKHHQQRLARTLKMPDQPLFDASGHHTLDNLIDGLILLVATDDLDLAMLFIGGKEREMLQDIQDDLWSQHTMYRCLEFRQPIYPFFLSIAPGGPQFER